MLSKILSLLHLCCISHCTLNMPLRYLVKLLLLSRFDFSASHLMFTILGWRWMAHITVTCCWLSSNCLSSVRSLAVRKCLPFLVLARQCCCMPSTRDTCLHLIRPVGPNSPTEYGRECSSSSTRQWRTEAVYVGNGLEQSVINDTINEWRRHLCACIHAKGWHISVISYKIYSARANFVIKRNRRRDQTRC